MNEIAADVQKLALTLFGAIPALTVSLVSRQTVSLMSCTQSAAARAFSSQYLVILEGRLREQLCEL